MGVIGGIGDTIKDVSKNITKANIKQFYSTYIKQSGDELAAAAKHTLSSKLDASSMIQKADIQDLINTSSYSIDGNADYINQTGKLLKSLQAKDMGQYQEIAQDISQRFKNEDKYLDLLYKANDNIKVAKEAINDFDEMDARRAYTNNIKHKIDNNTKLNKFLTNGQKEAIGKAAYHGNAALKYFASGDAKTNQIRMGAAAGVYMGAMTTARLAHGGGITKNEYGERDIVGIPFV